MGIFSSVGNFFKKAAGKVLETVGEKIPGPLGDKLVEAGWDLQYGKTGLSEASSFQETFDVTAECLKIAMQSWTGQPLPFIKLSKFPEKELTIAILK